MVYRRHPVYGDIRVMLNFKRFYYLVGGSRRNKFTEISRLIMFPFGT